MDSEELVEWLEAYCIEFLNKIAVIRFGNKAQIGASKSMIVDVNGFRQFLRPLAQGLKKTDEFQLKSKLNENKKLTLFCSNLIKAIEGLRWKSEAIISKQEYSDKIAALKGIEKTLENFIEEDRKFPVPDPVFDEYLNKVLTSTRERIEKFSKRRSQTFNIRERYSVEETQAFCEAAIILEQIKLPRIMKLNLSSTWIFRGSHKNMRSGAVTVPRLISLGCMAFGHKIPPQTVERILRTERAKAILNKMRSARAT